MKKKSEYMILNYKHRLFPTKEQKKLLDDQIFVANQVFNITLNILDSHRQNYNATEAHLEAMNKFFNTKIKIQKIKPISDTNLDRQIKYILTQRELYGELDTRQQERNIAKKAYFDGFKEKGFVSFRKSDSTRGGLSGVNARTTIGENFVKLSTRIGKIKIPTNNPSSSKNKRI